MTRAVPVHDPFPAIPRPTEINPGDITDLGGVTFRGDIRSFAWDGGGDLAGGVDVAATSGFFLDSSAGSAQFEGSLFVGGSFVLSGALEAAGDIYSSDWDGAVPANLSASEDGAATAGFYFDGSAGAAQFEGDIFLGGDLNLVGGGIIDFGNGFDLRTYTDNPALGEDSLWIRGNTDDTDHVVIGPASGSQWFKQIRLRANSVSLETADLTHPLPAGLVYDSDSVVDTTASVGTSESTKQSFSLSVPNGVPVVIFALAECRFEQSGDNRWVAMRTSIGGASQHLPMLFEADLTTSADGTGSTGSGSATTGSQSASHTHTVTHSGIQQVWDGISAHTTGSHVEGTQSASHTHSGGSHTHTGPSHTHTLDNQWQTLHSHQYRTFTTSGTTVTVALNMWCESGSQTLDTSVLTAWVVLG